MKTYDTYKNQISGIKDVSETVKTVEKVASSSVHFLKQKVSNLNAYAVEIEKMLKRLSLFYFYEGKDHPLLKEKETGKSAIIILTSDKGLVGGLWHRIVGSFLGNADRYEHIIVVGRKGENYLKEENISIVKSFTDFLDVSVENEVEHITSYVFDEFIKGTFSRVDIIYPEFDSLAEQNPRFIRFLPFGLGISSANNYGDKNTDRREEHKRRELSSAQALTRAGKNNSGLPIFEPSKKKVFEGLLRKYISLFFHKIVMEARLSELSARTVAMEHAAEKTKEIIKKLELDYIKQHHKITTQRQLESFAAHKIRLSAGKII